MLFGADRARQGIDEGVGKLFASVVLAALICAGCVGWSFIDRELAKDKQQQNPPTQVVSPTPTPVRSEGEAASDCPARAPSRAEHRRRGEQQRR